jgi:alginate O-acetyltransferase complex protein AlgI
MIFSSFEFLAFLIVLVLLLLALPARFRKLLLLLASYAFYAMWDLRFVPLLLLSTLLDYVVGRLLDRTHGPARRRWLIRASVVGNLGLLGFFKYYGFFVESLNTVLAGWGLSIPYLDILLPLGISFYTFRTMSYALDVYWGKLEPCRNVLDFGLYVAFFPHLIAGPIVRGTEFLPQLKRPVQISAANVWAGAQLFLLGLFKKFMIADAVAPFVNEVYAYPNYYSSTTVWLAVIAYALQIYCDFSGYSDMAIGCARMLGFYSGPNFDLPYLSKDVQEFWRRWHITLSDWLRDYLYIPLGGNRRGTYRTYGNLMITMVLGGLWHGANWNFVFWGAAHGVALIAHRWASTRRGRTLARDSSASDQPHARAGKVTAIARRVLGTASTFLFVTLAWVLFRGQDLGTILTIYRKLLFIGSAGASWYYTAALTAIGWTVFGHVVGSLRAKAESEPARPRERHSPSAAFFESPLSYAAAFAVIFALLIIYVFAPTNVSPFIYFQF